MVKSDLAVTVGKGCHTCYPGNSQRIHLMPWAWFSSTEPSRSWAVPTAISPLLSLREGKKSAETAALPHGAVFPQKEPEKQYFAPQGQ